MRLRNFLIGFSALILAACGRQQDAALADGNYFRGKTVTYIVATDAGGGYDTYGRLVARFMQKHLPGSRFLVKNVPGAGHIVGANTIYTARPDGLTIGMFDTALVYAQLLQRPGVSFDLRKMDYIGKGAHELRVVLVGTNSPYKSFNDMLHTAQPVKFAAAGVGTSAYLDTRLLDAIVPDLNIQTIPGFGGSQGELSMMRGETAAQVGVVSSLAHFVQAGHGYFALAMSEAAAKALPGVPKLSDYVKDEHGRRLLALTEALADIGRLTAGPPGIPEPVLAQLRRAHAEALADPELLEQAKRVDIPIVPGDGPYVLETLTKALDQPPETVALLRQAAAAQ
jgi:tripartite-type tricarboxylate transporter receptor subunit TctC